MEVWEEYNKIKDAYEKDDLNFKLVQENNEYTIDLNGLKLIGTKTIEQFLKNGVIEYQVTKIESPNYSYIEIYSDEKPPHSQKKVDLTIFKTTSGNEARILYGQILECVKGGLLEYSEKNNTESSKTIKFRGRVIKDAQEMMEHYFNSNGRIAYIVVKHIGKDYDDMYIDEYEGGRFNFSD